MVSLDLRGAAPVHQRAGVDPDVALLRAIEGQSSGTLTTPYAFDLVGVVSEAAAAWARRMALATVEPAAPWADAALLWRVAHGLAFYGEHVELIEVSRAGGVSLRPAIFHEVGGHGTDPDRWIYRVDVATPDRNVEADRRGAGVCHFRLPGRELWRGQHVLQNAYEFKAILARLERAMADESDVPSKHIIPVPEGTADETRRSLQGELRDRRKPVPLPATMAAAEGDGRALAPLSDWKAQRVRPEPSEEAVKLRAEVRDQALSCYGIPPASVGQSASGLRDPDRIFRQTMLAVARVVSLELSAKIGGPYEVRFGPAPADVSLMGRGLSALVESKLLTADQARRILGVT